METAPATDRDGLSVADGLGVLRRQKVALLVVAYEAERHIGQVLERIPREVAPLLAEICVLDDHSKDDTAGAALRAAERLGLANLRVYRTPTNRGYGGNQKVGFSHALRQGYDLVVLLHGDGQYPPERIADLLAPFADRATDVVLGSRMIHRRDALRGGMPLYKWLGNQVLTGFENRLLGTRLSEFHTGFRAYRVAALGRLPFRYGADTFHFDTEILIQAVSAGCGIVEVPIPTRYGDEICRVNGLEYAWDCARDVVHYRLFRLGLFYNPLLDFGLFESDRYYLKRHPNTLHQHVLGLDFSGQRLLQVGIHGGDLAAPLADRAREVVVASPAPSPGPGRARTLAVELNHGLDGLAPEGPFDTVVCLDVIEHLDDPEATAEALARLLKPGGRLLLSTANVAFFVTRAMLAMGWFNYGKRGILDRTHRRLFTIGSLTHLLRTRGFRVESVRGFGPPIRDLLGHRFPYRLLDGLLAWLGRHWPSLLAYNFLVTATRLPRLEEIYDATRASGKAPGAPPRPTEPPGAQA